MNLLLQKHYIELSFCYKNTAVDTAVITIVPCVVDVEIYSILTEMDDGIIHIALT